MNKFGFYSDKHQLNYRECLKKCFSTDNDVEFKIGAALYLIALAATIDNESLILSAFDYENIEIKMECLNNYKKASAVADTIMLAYNLMTNLDTYGDFQLPNISVLIASHPDIAPALIEAIKRRYCIE